MSISIKIELEGVKAALSKERQKRTQYALANQMLADMTMYVPYDKGPLRESGLVGSGGEEISWDTPYAKAQFYGGTGKANFYRYTTPGTGKRWDLKAKGNHLRAWLQVVANGLKV